MPVIINIGNIRMLRAIRIPYGIERPRPALYYKASKK